ANAVAEWLSRHVERSLTRAHLGEWLHDSAMSSLTHSKTRKRIAPSPAMTPSTTHIASLTHLYRSSSASNQMTMFCPPTLSPLAFVPNTVRPCIRNVTFAPSCV